MIMMETLQEKLIAAEEGNLRFQMTMDSSLWKLLREIIGLAMKDPIIASNPDGALYNGYSQLHSLLEQHQEPNKLFTLHIRPLGILLIKGAILLLQQTEVVDRFDLFMLSQVVDRVLYKIGFTNGDIVYLTNWE